MRKLTKFTWVYLRRAWGRAVWRRDGKILKFLRFRVFKVLIFKVQSFIVYDFGGIS